MIRYLKNLIAIALFLFLGCYLLGFFFFPKQTQELVKFRFYTILTDSMEPRIPTYSLVCVKNIVDIQELQPEDIITFRIEKFKEEKILTHYFAYRETIDNTIYYRTHPENTNALDPYDVEEEDVIGTYVFHIPYAGKLILFFQSPFGIFAMSIGTLFLILYKYLDEHFDLEEEVGIDSFRLQRKHHPKEYVCFEDMQIQMDPQFIYVQGALFNETSVALGYIKACFVFYNEQGNIVTSHTFYVNGKDKLEPQHAIEFHFMLEQVQDIYDYQISIRSAKR